MFKCVMWCDKKAEYILFGKSLCKYHFDELMKKIEEIEKERESREKK